MNSEEKGNIIQNKYENEEQRIQMFWEDNKIYEKVKAQLQGKEPFYLCDGPPYVTGYIHPGTALNKCVKDAVARFWRFLGYDVRAQPGFDTHGLPIEVKVEQKLGLKTKKEIEEIGIEKFIHECKSFAEHFIGIMTSQFKSLGVWMDWDAPYITFKDDYIEKSWITIKMAEEKGLLKQGNYVVAFCPRCETSLANYELEYKDKLDPSIFVKFPVKDRPNTFLIIWTTTPWTLVANLAVMAHPTEHYVEIEVDEERWILAKARLDVVMQMIGKDAVVVKEFIGKELKELYYNHPFQDLISKEYERKVVLNDEHVTMEEGTGLVHCAPGHGYEDFLVGKDYGISPFSPVNEKGCYTEEAGQFFAGKSIFEANQEIIEILKERNLLIYETKINHRYPHCWRCKSPLFFRATEQWFIEISSVKNEMLSAVERVNWVPKFVKTRMKNFVEIAPDWCISRQRYWGIPLPIWICEKCGKRIVVGSREELGQQVKELHRPYIDEVTFTCVCGGKMHRVKDVLDVWFDSGNAVWASLRDDERNRFGEIADFIVEGQDQIRGWFYSLLGSGIVKNGSCPYKTVLMHGFFVDEKGEKMSKSVGNFVPVEEILARYGADAFRLWGMSNVLWEDIKFNWEGVKEARADLNILLNLIQYLNRFFESEWSEDAERILKEGISKDGLAFEDQWFLSRLERTKKIWKEAMERYEVHEAVRKLRFFMVEDLSRFYMKIVKERKKSKDWKIKMLLLYKALFESALMLSIFAPHTSEQAYQSFFKKYCKEESIFLHSFSDIDESLISDVVEKKMNMAKELISAMLDLRQKAGINLRWPLSTAYIHAEHEDVAVAIKEAKDIIAQLTNVKEIVIGEGEGMEQELSFGKIWLNTTLTHELELEGYYAEVKRRVQMLRKSMNLVESDKIDVVMEGDEIFREVVEKFADRLKDDVGATSVEWGEPKGELVKEFKIKGKLLKIAITLKKPSSI